MSQGPLSNQNSMGIDPSTLSFSGMRSMDPLQDGMSAANMGNPMAGDSSMAGMLDDSMFSAFDNVPMSLDGTGTFDDADSKGMSALDPSTMHALSTDTPDGVDSNEVNADVQMSGVGAGPLPTGFGAQTMLSGGSTLADFTKRRNWSQKVVEELKDMLHILTPDGQIIYISPSGKALTGHDPEELVGKYIVDYIHPDDSGIFVREFNEAIATGHRLRFFYRFRKEDGTFTIFESHGHPHLTSEPGTYGQHGAVGICRGFFIMSRPYPTKNALLLDSFLEHKIENERLRKRIADLKREEAEDAEETHRNWIKRTDSRSDIAASDDASMSTGLNTTDPDALAMPPPAKPGISKSGLTQRNLEDVNAHTQPDSIDDKMARYEGASHIETIEMLTGLRYQEGERSRGISTGDMSPSLIRGDAGIIIPAEKEVRSNDKKKKIKVVDEYVCTDCGTLDSPEWRKGPNGPKTLCNACGLRWAKKEKKRSGNGNSASHVTS